MVNLPCLDLSNRTCSIPHVRHTFPKSGLKCLHGRFSHAFWNMHVQNLLCKRAFILSWFLHLKRTKGIHKSRISAVRSCTCVRMRSFSTRWFSSGKFSKDLLKNFQLMWRLKERHASYIYIHKTCGIWKRKDKKFDHYIMDMINWTKFNW